MDRGAWWATVHGAAEWDTTEFSLQQSGQPDQWTSKRHRVSPAPRGTAVWTARPMDRQASPCELRFPRNRSAAPSLGPHPSPAASRTLCCLPWKNAAAFWPGPPSSPFLRLQPDMCQIGTHLALLKTEPKCETKLSSGLRPPLRPPLSPRAPGYSPQTRRAPSTEGAGSSQPCPAAGYPRRAEPHPHRHPLRHLSPHCQASLVTLCTPACLPGGQGCPRPHPHGLIERPQDKRARGARCAQDCVGAGGHPPWGGLRAEPTGLHTHASAPQRHSCPAPGPCSGPSGVFPSQCCRLAQQPRLLGGL